MSNRKTLAQMSTTEAKRAGITSLADRPNDKSRYGDGGLTSTMLKERFDALPNLVRDRFNSIAAMLASTDAAKYITLGGEDNALGETLFDFLALFGARGDGITDKNISDLIETLYQKEDSTVNVSTPIKEIVHDIERRIVKANAGRVTNARFDVASNSLIISFAGGNDLSVDLSAIVVGEGVSGEIEQLKDTDADHERRISNIEEHISDDYFVTDETVAYEKAVPARACSSAKLLSLGGMSHKSKNLLDGSKFIEGSASIRGITYSYDTDTQIYTINGTMDTDGNIAAKMINIKGKKDSTYIVRTEVVGGSATVPSGGYALVYFGSADSTTGAYTNWLDCSIGTSQVKSKVLPHEYIARAWFYITQGVVFDNLQVKVMVAETSDTTLPYEPFYEGLRDSKVPEIVSRDTDGNVIAIRPIPAKIQVSKGISGFGGDTIDFANKKLIKKTRTVVVDGVNVRFSAANTANGYNYAAILLPSKPTAWDAMICSHFTTKWGSVPGQCYTVILETSKVLAYPLDQTLDTTEKFNAWAKAEYDNGTPITVTYVEAESIETDISTELEGFDNIIEVEGGGSLEFVNEYKNPVPSAVKYLLKEESAV